MSTIHSFSKVTITITTGVTRKRNAATRWPRFVLQDNKQTIVEQHRDCWGGRHQRQHNRRTPWPMMPSSAFVTQTLFDECVEALGVNCSANCICCSPREDRGPSAGPWQFLFFIPPPLLFFVQTQERLTNLSRGESVWSLNMRSVAFFCTLFCTEKS